MCVKSQFKYFHRLPFLHQNQPTQAIHGWLKMKKNSAIKILWLPLLSNRKRYSGNILWNAIKTWINLLSKSKFEKKPSGLRLFCQNKSPSAMSRHILEFLPFYKKKINSTEKKRIYPHFLRILTHYARDFNLNKNAGESLCWIHYPFSWS